MLELSGVWVPLVTPFREGELDLPALDRLVRRLVIEGIAGFVVCGSIGEAALLDEAEQAAVLRTTLAAAGDRPVLMGLAGPRPALLAQRLKALARDHALAGFLVSSPGYIKPSQAGLIEYFNTIADASPLPIVAYDIPSRSGVRIEAETLLALAAHRNMRGVKDCSSDADAALRVLADGRLAWLCGNDDEIFDQLARG
ncbi:MAG: dihydrodipicolinate synthase family protein, partial [Burkholderiales bacterium]|nr:dihydrodipicolinate synthase family protein [Burkholderiales bacterium]